MTALLLASLAALSGRAHEHIALAPIRDVMHGASDALYACVADEPPGELNVTVRFHIAPDGSVSELAVVRSDLPEGNELDCIVRTVRALRFRALPSRAGGIQVTYPLRWVR